MTGMVSPTAALTREMTSSRSATVSDVPSPAWPLTTSPVTPEIVFIHSA
jgi:hypothetical protein